MSSKAPAAPDPVATANAQSAANRNTAITQHQLNMVDQFGPTGSVTYSRIGDDFVTGRAGDVGVSRYYIDPATGEYKSSGQDGWQEVHGTITPRYAQTTTMSPEQQAIFNASQGAELNLANLAKQQSGMLGELMANPLSFGNLEAEQWAYDRASPRILEQQRQNETALRSTLAAKGIREGSAAWNAEMGRLTNANTDQMNQLELTGRAQAVAEAQALRNQPINEITALLSGSQVSNPTAMMGGATPQTQVAGVDYTGLVNQQYQQQLAAHQNKMGGLFGLGGSLLGAAGNAGGFGSLFAMSDVRTKTDIRRVGKTDGGMNVYAFRYKHGGPMQLGVMAQEVAEIDPTAVATNDDGVMFVDYGKVH